MRVSNLNQTNVTDCRTSQTNHFCNSLNAENLIAETQY